MATDRGIKEWSAVINAMGEGKQSLLIRIYEPATDELLLYPTFNFYGSNKNRPEIFDNMFQESFRKKAREAGERTMERAHKDGIVDIDFFARIDQVYTIHPNQSNRVWERMAPYFVWSWKHVADYAKTSRYDAVWLWLCRVYRFNKPLEIGRSSALPPNSYRHFEQVNTSNARPVLSDADFERVKSEIVHIIDSSKAPPAR